MAVANVGRLLAARAQTQSGSVLIVDWDLEAPGLHHYVQRETAPDQPGVIDYFQKAYAMLAQPDGHESAERVEVPPLNEYVIATKYPGLDLMTAGRFDGGYSERVAQFDWVGSLFDQSRKSIDAFREAATARYQWVLIDSRTGISDTSGICTTLLPDKLVAMFAPNRQNLDGLSALIPRILHYRNSSVDERPLTVFPVPSRFDTMDLREYQAYMNEFRDRFSEIFSREYKLESCDLRAHFSETMLPYVPTYSYGERVVVDVEEPDFPGSLRAAYRRLGERLTRDVPW